MNSLQTLLIYSKISNELDRIIQIRYVYDAWKLDDPSRSLPIFDTVTYGSETWETAGKRDTICIRSSFPCSQSLIGADMYI